MEIDLNSDLGEGFGPWKMGDDEALMQVISSANIACGYHAGDPVIMDATVRLAAQRGIDIGAHVGFPDLMGFGRRQIDANPAEVAKYVVYQLGALAGIAKAAGCQLTHMSFHGAMGNMAAADIKLGRLTLASEIIVPCPRSYYFVCPESYLAMPKLQGLLAWLRESARGSPTPPPAATRRSR